MKHFVKLKITGSEWHRKPHTIHSSYKWRHPILKALRRQYGPLLKSGRHTELLCPFLWNRDNWTQQICMCFVLPTIMLFYIVYRQFPSKGLVLNILLKIMPVIISWYWMTHLVYKIINSSLGDLQILVLVQLPVFISFLYSPRDATLYRCL